MSCWCLHTNLTYVRQYKCCLSAVCSNDIWCIYSLTTGCNDRQPDFESRECTAETTSSRLARSQKYFSTCSHAHATPKTSFERLNCSDTVRCSFGFPTSNNTQPAQRHDILRLAFCPECKAGVGIIPAHPHLER